jgi:aspartate carbamoyltransferase regulatory subunit
VVQIKADKDIAKTKSAELSNYQVKQVPAIIPGSTILNALTNESTKIF